MAPTLTCNKWTINLSNEKIEFKIQFLKKSKDKIWKTTHNLYHTTWNLPRSALNAVYRMKKISVSSDAYVWMLIIVDEEFILHQIKKK